MKVHTQSFKNNIKEMGRELDSKITYSIDNEKIELNNSELNSVTPIFESSILKSVMKELDIDSNVDIPLGTIINYKLGVKLNESDYEYLNYGNYIVFSSEKQEDTNSYNIVCFDKMLYSMIPYKKVSPKSSTLKSYIIAICEYLGIKFADIDTFVNYNKVIKDNLYIGADGSDIGYTFRDVLDEIAQVTASTIVINDNDELEIRYINDTNDTINKNYLKDINVNFGEKYGPVNSIVLSRSAESDNVYLRNEQSIKENGLCEIKIKDNQIMNFNDRSDFLPEILQKLNGLEYYINDFNSTGICYYDICDRYNVKIDDKIYSCIMFNDEIKVSQGLEEVIFTDLPEVAETDYSKSDTTDRRINQTYLIVDKQNQQIEATIEKVDGQDKQISQVIQKVNELSTKISDTLGTTITGTTTLGTLQLNNINQSNPIEIYISPTSENISYLYPRNSLYPNNNLFMPDRKIIFENTKTNEIFELEILDDLLIGEDENDNIVFRYNDEGEAEIWKSNYYDSDGTIKPMTPKLSHKSYDPISLTDGDYRIYLLGYNSGYLNITLMIQNMYTEQFATRVEVNSKINQTANQIQTEINQVEYVFDEEVRNLNSRITQTANDITSEVSKKADNTIVQSQFKQTAEEISSKITKTDDGVELASLIRQTPELIYFQANNFGWISKYSSMTTNGIFECSDANIKGNITSSNAIITGGNLDISASYGHPKILTRGSGVMNSECLNYIEPSRIYIDCNSQRLFNVSVIGHDENEFETNMKLLDTEGRYIVISPTRIYMPRKNGTLDTIIEPDYIQTSKLIEGSLATMKKNFEKLENALSIINDIDIYKYNLKDEKNSDKKHIGFVIGEDFNYSSEITGLDENGKEIGADIYSMASLCLQAIKEQQEIIKKQNKKIKKLQKQINNLYGIIKKENDK